MTSIGFEPPCLSARYRCDSNQLSYEATDVGSWSIMCSYVSVKEMNVIDVYLNRNRYYGNITLIFVILQSIYKVFFGHFR